jgi:hypothetical protein
LPDQGPKDKLGEITLACAKAIIVIWKSNFLRLYFFVRHARVELVCGSSVRLNQVIVRMTKQMCRVEPAKASAIGFWR